MQHVDSFGAWKALVSSAFVPLHSEPVRAGSFAGSIAGSQFGSVGVMEVEATAHVVRRTENLLAAGDQPQFKLNLQISGHGILLQDGRETLLRPGELAIYDTQRPYTLLFEEEFKTLVLMFPQQQLGLPATQVREMTATTIGTEHPLGRAITPFLGQLAGLLPHMQGPVGHRLATNAVDLLSTLLAAELHEHDGSAVDGHHRQIRSIQAYIDEHLSDPELCPGSIAEAQYVSLRSLHKIFAESGHTVAEWIRTRRLEQCRRDLSDPIQHHVPVGAVGARWGLPDAAHFSRVFRAAYGNSPSAFRAQS
ncbi:helix-turn-helix domain-containing protein [Arthrobacter sp. AQ5-05]|uniref:AraC-like ligand-binding domain-containing protein n=1 Tax=Arthrobacter sp. AQ5-05 TaxID=2184581 RepID=UPI0025700D67|nr:helix-turn-helix domain-containing protein [Arthrobacter sp. AQ5-05]